MKTPSLPRRRILLSALALAGVALGLPTLAAAQSPGQQKGATTASSHATHEQIKAVTVRSKDGRNHGVQTFCLDKEGRILALAAPQRGYGASARGATAEIQMLDADGNYLKHWKVDFHAQSVNVGPDGVIYVAGDGKVAKFNPDGALIAQIDLPHIKEILKDQTGLRKRAEDQLKQQQTMYEQMTKQYTDRVKQNEAKPEDKRTTADKNNLRNYKMILKSYEETSGQMAKRKLDDVVNELAGRVRIINGIAVSPRDLFICCGETQGYGYAMWRLNLDFSAPKLVKSGVRGCCGQMDIQCCGEDLLIAENCNHQFARYDRDGKELARGGKRGKETDPGCFGSCCNPMNVHAAANGDIYTAESEGHVKRFAKDGKFLGFVGSCKLQGGCKNVALAVSPKGDKIYFCDQPGSRILIMAEKKATAQRQ